MLRYVVPDDEAVTPATTLLDVRNFAEEACKVFSEPNWSDRLIIADEAFSCDLAHLQQIGATMATSLFRSGRQNWRQLSKLAAVAGCGPTSAPGNFAVRQFAAGASTSSGSSGTV